MKFWLQRLQDIFNIYTDIYPHEILVAAVARYC